MSETTMSSSPSRPTLLRRLSDANWVEPVLGAMIAIYGLLTGFAAYRSGLYGGNSTEQYFIGLSDLSDANAAYAQGNQQYAEDNGLFIQMQVQEVLVKDKEAFTAVFDSLFENLSPGAQEAINPETLEWDEDTYSAGLYRGADALQANSDKALDAAAQWDALGDSFDFLVLILALGLGFAAWGSLMDREGITRYVFGALGAILLVIGIGYTIYLETRPLPPQLQSCWKDPVCSAELGDV